MTTYRIVDAPDNGTAGQLCGSFAFADLPERLKAAILAAPDADAWVLPALAEGDSGAELDDLSTVVTREENDDC